MLTVYPSSWAFLFSSSLASPCGSDRHQSLLQNGKSRIYQVDLAEELSVQLLVADPPLVEEIGDDVGEAVDARAELRHPPPPLR